MRSNFTDYKINEIIQQKGEIPQRTAFILEGAVRLFYVDERGREQTTAFLFENHPLVAIDSFTQQAPLLVNAIALEPTRLIWTSNEDFFDYINIYPKYKGVLLNVISKFLSEEGEQRQLLRIQNSRERYDALFRKRPEVIRRVPQKYIASYLGMAEETLSRIRSGNL